MIMSSILNRFRTTWCTASLLLLLFCSLSHGQEEIRGDWPDTLPGVQNAREISGMVNEEGHAIRPGVLVRSGTLAKANPEAVEALHAYGLKKLVDIRTWEEIMEDGMAPAPFGRKPYLVRMRTDVQEFTLNHNLLYPRIWNENKDTIRYLVQMLADPKNHPLMIQGQQGVDRTGIMVAALLELAGVSREEILYDFMDFRQRTPPRGALEKVFQIWDAHPEGLTGWLIEHAGVHPLTIEAYRHTLFSGDPYAKAKDQIAAERLFERARKDAIKGKYPQAVKKYEGVYKKYPKTAAGTHAARRTQPNAFLCWAPMVVNGPPANRIDIVLMGDGYTLDQMEVFENVIDKVPDFFERHTIFGEYYSYHNIYRAALRSEEAGVDKLGEDTYSTILNGHDSGAKQGQVAVSHDRVMRQLDELPEHDRLAAVFVKNGKGGTGGGGVATVGGTSYATLIHEWGHAFGELKDEYTADTGYRGPVKSGVNVSNSPDPEKAPWRHWIEAGRKEIGVFEGADGREEGAWKPSRKGCAMEGGTRFCVVCQEALVLRIYGVVDPIDSCDPPHHVGEEEDPFAEPVPPLEGTSKMVFKVSALRPASHALEVRWWVLPEDRVPPPPKGAREGYRFGDRRDRGPLSPIAEEPAAKTKADRKGFHTFTLHTRGMDPGRYRVICRVTDATRIPGDDWPWVLKDSHGVLQSERAWWVEIN